MHEEKKRGGGESDERDGKRGNSLRNKLISYQKLNHKAMPEEDKVVIII